LNFVVARINSLDKELFQLEELFSGGGAFGHFGFGDFFEKRKRGAYTIDFVAKTFAEFLAQCVTRPDSHRKTEKRNLLLHQSPKFGKFERKSDKFVGFLRNCKNKYQAAEQLTNTTPSVRGTRTFRPKIV
jgi:hypothetical protein